MILRFMEQEIAKSNKKHSPDRASLCLDDRFSCLVRSVGLGPTARLGKLCLRGQNTLY